MRKLLGRRGTLATGIVSAAFALTVGMSGTANADALFEYENVNVKITGGESLAVNQCIADAKDGVINYAQNQCDQMASGGNYVEIHDGNVWVYQGGTWWPAIASAMHVTVTFSGGSSAAINQCIADATDGVINYAQNQCTQVAVAGNTIFATGVYVMAEQ